MPAAMGPNYTYDGSGNLIGDYADGTRIKWNAYGKVERVRRLLPGNPAQMPIPLNYRQEIYFLYDASGNRVAKYVLDFKESPVPLPPAPPNPPSWTKTVTGQGTVTYYVRDANGQVLAVYERALSTPDHDEPCWPNWFSPPSSKDPDRDGIEGMAPPAGFTCDNCAMLDNPWQEDYDGDNIGDACDPCPLITNPLPCLGEAAMPVPFEKPELFEEWEATSTAPIVLAELHIYGNAAQGRIGMYVPNQERDRTVDETTVYVRQLRKKQYELKDHLGNVRVVMSDLKLDDQTGVVGITDPGPWNGDIISYNNYYPFGMVQPGRHGNTKDYRYGFNGMEMDNEIKEDPTSGEIGIGNSYSTEFRMMDPRLGRWWSLDPIFRADISMYAVMSNDPIARIDPQGDDDCYSENGDYIYTDSKSSSDIRIIKYSDFFAEQQKMESILNSSGSSLDPAAVKSDFEKTIQANSGIVSFEVPQGDYALGQDDVWYDMWEMSNLYIGGDGKEKSGYLILDISDMNSPRVYFHHNNSANNTPTSSSNDKIYTSRGERPSIDDSGKLLVMGQIHTHPPLGSPTQGMGLSVLDADLSDNRGLNVYALELVYLQRRLVGGKDEDYFGPIINVYHGKYDLAREIFERGGGEP